MARPLRGGGGKGRATKEKRTFYKTFFSFFCHLKIKIISLQTTYPNIDISRLILSVGAFNCTWLLQCFPKNRAILVQKLWGEKKLSKSVFGYFKTKNIKKKKAWPLVEELFFCGFPQIQLSIYMYSYLRVVIK